eukprot:scaffold4536_cov113-Isochrysis_galbana.AAC.8
MAMSELLTRVLIGIAREFMAHGAAHDLVGHRNESRAAPDPVTGARVRRQQEVAHVVRGVPRGGERAGAHVSFVEWTVVPPSGPRLVQVLRLEPDDVHWSKQLPHARLGHRVLRDLKARPLHHHAVHVGAIVRRRRRVLEALVRHDFSGEAQHVNGQLVPARVRLECRREEALGEEEGRDPEGCRRPAPCDHVLAPRAERLERGVPLAALSPWAGDLLEEEVCVRRIELCAHHDETLERALHLLEHGRDGAEQPVELLHLVGEKDAQRVHRAILQLIKGRFGRLAHIQFRRQPRQQVVAHLSHHLVGRLARGAAARARLHRDDGVEHVARLLLLEGDVGVLVQAKDLRPVHNREGGDERALRAVRVAGVVDGARIHVRSQNRAREPDVLRIGHAAAVDDVGDDGVERLERCLRLLIDHQPKVLLRKDQIGGHPLVGDVPADRAVLAPLLDHRIEENEAEEELFERPRLGARLKLGHIHVDVGAYGDREFGRGHRGEPQPEVLVDRLVFAQALHHPIKPRQPRDGEVAVLQADPMPGAQTLGNKPLRDGPLPLPK